MAKLTLNLDELSVDSFDIAGEELENGTVQGFESEGETEFGPSCRNCPSRNTSPTCCP